MIFDLARTARELLRTDPAKVGGPAPLVTRLTDLLFYGDFEIFEQVASISGADHTNIVGYRPAETNEGGLLLSAPLGIIEEPPAAEQAAGGARRTRGKARRNTSAPIVREGRIWGPAATAGRLALLCQISAAASFPRGELRRPVFVAGTFGEEHGGSGTRFLLESGNVQPQWVVVGAATNLEIVRAHRGYLLFRVEISERGEPWRGGFPVRSGYHIVLPGAPASRVPWGGRGGTIDRGLEIATRLAEQPSTSIHGLVAGQVVNRPARRCAFDLLSTAERPPDLPWDAHATALGDDAKLSVPVQACLRAWRRLRRRLASDFAALCPIEAPEFEPAGSLWKVGRVETNARGLVVWFDYRTLPDEDPYAVFQTLERAAQGIANDADEAVAIDVRATVNRPAMNLPPDSPLTDASRRALRAQGLLPVLSTLPLYSDGAMYASCGLDTVVLGPGWWGDAATAGEESIPMNHLELAVEVYRALIRDLCS